MRKISLILLAILLCLPSLGRSHNPVMFELMSELPWRPEPFTKEEWIKDWCFARYGVRDAQLEKAWTILAQSIYNCPRGNNFEYDLIDIVRQAIADNARITYQHSMADYRAFNLEGYRHKRDRFLESILVQDELLSGRETRRN